MLRLLLVDSLISRSGSTQRILSADHILRWIVPAPRKPLRPSRHPRPIESELVDDLTLIPPFVPPLRGRPVMTHFARVSLLENMTDMPGETQAHHVNLLSQCGERILCLIAAVADRI